MGILKSIFKIENFSDKRVNLDTADDYSFVTEFYEPTDSRYKIVAAYNKRILDKKKIEVYNCKITIPQSNLIQKFIPQFLGMEKRCYYNVYVYLKDKEKDSPSINWDYPKFPYLCKEFTDLFKQTLREYPIKKLADKAMNPNGVFINDFLECSQSYALKKAFRALQNALKRKYPQIKRMIRFDKVIHVLFQKNYDFVDYFDEKNVDEFKRYSYEIIKPFDIDNVWTVNILSFMLDDYSHYLSMGFPEYREYIGHYMPGVYFRVGTKTMAIWKQAGL